MAATTDVAEMFRYTYAKEDMQYLASQEIVMWNLLKPRMKEQGGRGQAIVPIQTTNAGVFRGHTEGGALTTRRSQPGSAEATFSLQEFHGIWDISWKMPRAASKSEWAFAKALDFMDTSMRRRVFRLINADYGTGFGYSMTPETQGFQLESENAMTVGPLKPGNFRIFFSQRFLDGVGPGYDGEVTVYTLK